VCRSRSQDLYPGDRFQLGVKRADPLIEQILSASAASGHADIGRREHLRTRVSHGADFAAEKQDFLVRKEGRPSRRARRVQGSGGREAGINQMFFPVLPSRTLASR